MGATEDAASRRPAPHRAMAAHSEASSKQAGGVTAQAPAAVDVEPTSVFLRACRGLPVERTPVWLLRQAGRYLPEYRALREKHALLELIRTPELAAQVTLLPVETFALDAAIVFSDILPPLVGMGLELEFVAGAGALQVFDSWAGRALGRDDYLRYVAPYNRELFAAVAQAGVPVVNFSLGVSAYLEVAAGCGGDVAGLDWHLPLDEAWARVGF